MLIDSNGNLQQIQVAGSSAGSPPTWATIVGNPTTDGGITWKMIQTAASMVWAPNTHYAAGQYIIANAVGGTSCLYQMSGSAAPRLNAGTKAYLWSGPSTGVFDKFYPCSGWTTVLSPASLNWDGDGSTTKVYAVNGNGTIGAGTSIGYGSNFETAVVGTVHIGAAGTYTFCFSHDDGAIIGFDSNVTKVSGTGVNPKGQPVTANMAYKVFGGNNYNGVWTDYIVVTFPAAGDYGFEIDYAQGQHAAALELSCMPGVASVYPIPSAMELPLLMLWSNGTGLTGSGNVVTLYYNDIHDSPGFTDASMNAAFTAGNGYVTMFGMTDSYAPLNGTWKITGYGASRPPGSGDTHNWVTFTAPSSTFIQGNPTGDGRYRQASGIFRNIPPAATSDTSDATAPVWPNWTTGYAPNYPSVTETGGYQWLNRGPATDFAWIASTPFTMPVAAPIGSGATWQAAAKISAAGLIDANVNGETAYRAGVSGGGAPTFGTDIGTLTTEGAGGLTWIEVGPRSVTTTFDYYLRNVAISVTYIAPGAGNARAVTTDTITLPLNQNLGLVQVRYGNDLAAGDIKMYECMGRSDRRLTVTVR